VSWERKKGEYSEKKRKAPMCEKQQGGGGGGKGRGTRLEFPKRLGGRIGFLKKKKGRTPTKRSKKPFGVGMAAEGDLPKW